jgi:cell fate regulator YaaT (PSP1 superfamily)
MCCLKYEEEVYEYLNRGLPSIGDIIQTTDGEGEILSINVLRQIIKAAVRKKSGDDAVIGFYALPEIKLLSKAKLIDD